MTILRPVFVILRFARGVSNLCLLVTNPILRGDGSAHLSLDLFSPKRGMLEHNSGVPGARDFFRRLSAAVRAHRQGCQTPILTML